MKKGYKIGCIYLPLLLIVLILIPTTCNYVRNRRLAGELREETDAWRKTLAEIPESENGAKYICEGAGMLDWLVSDDVLHVDGHLIRRIGNDEQAQRMQEYLAKNREALDLVEKGLSYEKWQYVTGLGNKSGASMPEIRNLNNLRHYMLLEASLLEYRGNIDRAFEKYLDTLEYAGTLTGDKSYIARAYALGTGRVSSENLLRMINEYDIDNELSGKAIDSVDKFLQSLGPYREVFETEYHLLMTDFAGFLKSIKFGLEIDGDAYPALPTPLYYYGETIDVFRKAVDVCSEIAPGRYYEMPEYLKDNSLFFEKVGIKNEKPLLAYMLISRPADMLILDAQSHALCRALMLIAAIEVRVNNTGELPGNLEETRGRVPEHALIDPFAGEKFIYRIKEDDYWLYSAGKNGIDDKCRDSDLVYKNDNNYEMPDILFHKPE